MRIRLGLEFDEGAWPGVLGDGEGVLGEAWLGPLGLLGLLETQLGLGGPREPACLRAAALVPDLGARVGFWSRSAEIDPLSTARRLLFWRDELVLAGWRGEPVCPWAEALWGVTRAAAPGTADRVLAVARDLRLHAAPISTVDLVDPRSELPALWRAVLEQLERHGTRVQRLALPAAPATGDLAAARETSFTPTGDGSLQLIRPPGPVQAAEEVAAWLAAQPSLEGTVVVGPDPVLDQAFARAYLPTLGIASRHRDGALLQILPLVLELAWDPPDPQRVHEFLTLPRSPVPRGAAARLVRALQRWPAVGSDAWTKAVDAALASSPTDSVRDRLARTLSEVFSSSVPRGQPYPCRVARERSAFVGRWLSDRLEGARPDAAGSWSAAVCQGETFARLLDAAGLDELSVSQLRDLVTAATQQAPPARRSRALAGMQAVGGPGGVAGAVRRVVWWSFRRDAVSQDRRWPLTHSELRAFRAAGIDLPTPAARAAQRARAWSRPLEQATEALLLVCPRTGRDGRSLYPHPLWQEIHARLGRDDDAERLVRPRPCLPGSPQVATPPSLPCPQPRREWRAPAGSGFARTEESPTSLGTLVGCPLKWALTYAGKIRRGRSDALPSGARLFGSLAHEIVESVVERGLANGDLAARVAEALFDEIGPRRAAELFCPGASEARGRVRHTIARAASTLTDLFRTAELTVAAVEKPLHSQEPGFALGGRPDLVAAPLPLVIDLKWGGASYYRTQLEAGTAYQLAVYARLVQASPDARGTYPLAGYFVLADAQLLALGSHEVRGAVLVEGPSLSIVWNAMAASVADRYREIADGRLEAPGNPDAADRTMPDKHVLSGEQLILAPPCRFCELDTLCGRAFGDLA